MNNTSFSKLLLFVFAVVLFASCDNDFNDVGGNIIGDDNFNVVGEPFQISAYNHKVGLVQSNNLPLNPLGIYINPAFGTTTANYATQVLWPPNSTIPTIALNLDPQIESAILTVPYFSKKLSTGTNGEGIYDDLDSIYGGAAGKIKLSVYETKFFIDALNHNDLTSQIYYTNQSNYFEGANLGTLLNDTTIPAQYDAFEFSNAEITETVTTDTPPTVTRSAPAMRLVLNNTIFQNKLFTAAGTGNLSSNNQLINYFRGLYFKCENSGSFAPNMALMNFANGKITVKYNEFVTAPTVDVPVPERVKKTLTLNLGGTTVSLQEQSGVDVDYSAAVNTPNTVAGDESLWLKGGEGSMAIINLFGTTDVITLNEATGTLIPGSNSVSDELDQLRASKKLINDAVITFFIDRTNFPTGADANRIYLFDLENRAPLLDYSYDGTTRSSYKFNKYVHNGIINYGNKVDDLDDSYKIKITNHIRNLINDHSAKNVKLGLVVTENINDFRNVVLNTPIPIPTGINDPNKVWDKYPEAAVINPLGTVLYGTNTSVDATKRIKFQIHYTNPN